MVQDDKYRYSSGAAVRLRRERVVCLARPSSLESGEGLLYRVSLVSLEERYADSETLAKLDVDGRKGRAVVTDPDPRYARELEAFADTLENEGVVLLAESMSDGVAHGPFDMWVTPPTSIEQLDALVFPDLIHAVFDYKIDGKYVRLSPVFGTRSPGR
jgi:hypothetical protein